MKHQDQSRMELPSTAIRYLIDITRLVCRKQAARFGALGGEYVGVLLRGQTAHQIPDTVTMDIH